MKGDELMVKVRVLRNNGDWDVAVISFVTYLYGKFWLTVSNSFRQASHMLCIKLIMPWEEKYLR